jgi:hypothetical protein
VNGPYAAMWASFFGVQAARLGVMPQELYAKFAPRIVAEVPKGELADQGLSQNARGSFNPQTNTVALLKGADLSTFLHESGHFFLEAMHSIASQPDAPQPIKDDLATFLKWSGVEGGLERWNAMTLDESAPTTRTSPAASRRTCSKARPRTSSCRACSSASAPGC